MAQRDRTQGFGFVYLDIAKLLKQAKPHYARPEKAASTEAKAAETVNFNKDPQPAAATKTATSQTHNSAPIDQIRGNLDRLQTLHHQLHAMLEELNKITVKKRG